MVEGATETAHKYSWRLAVYPNIPFAFGFLYFCLDPKASYLLLTILLLPVLVGLLNLLRTQVRIGEKGIELRGLAWTTSVPWSDLKRVKWPAFPASLVLFAERPIPSGTPESEALGWRRIIAFLLRILRKRRIPISPALERFDGLLTELKLAASRHAPDAVVDLRGPAVGAGPEAKTQGLAARIFSRRRVVTDLIPFALAVSAILVFETWIRGLEDEVDARERAVKELGLPITGSDLERPSRWSKKSDNAAPVYVAAGSVLKGLEGEPFDSWCSNLRDPEFTIPEEHLEWARRTVLENGIILPILDEAADRPESRYPVRYSDGVDAKYEFAGPVRSVSWFLLLRTLATVDTDHEQAVDSVLRIFDLPYSMRNEPTQLGMLIRWGYQKAGFGALRHLLGRADPSEESLADVTARIDRELGSLSLSRTLAGERVYALQIIDDVVDDTLDEVTGHGSLFGCGHSRPILPPLHKPLVLKSKLLVLKAYERAFEHIPEEGLARYDARVVEPFDEAGSQWGIFTSVGAMATVWGRTTVRRHFEAVAELRAAKAAILVEIFQRRAGRLSSDMAEVADTLDTPLPEDPFSAAGLLFRKTGAGYVVYSVGVNGVDDGGDDSAEASRPDVAFEVHLQAAVRQVGGKQ